MNNREELIRIIQQILYGMLEVRLIDEIAPRVADGILNSGYVVAKRLGRNCIGIELNPEYAEMAKNR